jgi:predicted transcriptional regulator
MEIKKQQKLGERELDIMQALWQQDEATVSEIQKQLQENGIELAYTTIMTMLGRLEAKEMVVRDNSERAHRYKPLVKEPSAVGSAIKKLAERFFNGSVEALAARLVEQELSPEQLRRVQAIIDENSHGEKGK